MGLLARLRRLSQPLPDNEAARLAAIRSIVELVDAGEDCDVVAEALLVLGASPDEILVAMLGG